MANRLTRSTSPYLLQHQDNPVDWYEWGDEAFEAARERDVPVLLSVGYSACHWCHVMAHESFQNPEIAAEMNRRFVNVKVDREERPDVDAIYMEAVQAMTGQGGWPMTVWLTPEGRPFYAGTYFPDRDRHGMPGFPTVMRAVSEAWESRRLDVVSQSQRLTDAISRRLPALDEVPGEEALRSAYQSLEKSYDHLNGGFGDAPKFPQQPVLDLLLRFRGEPWAPRAGEMLAHTLTEMGYGGIHDQLGGGFARYSVDDQWLVPHFEKMLYDNAQLARIYLWAGVELGEPYFVEVAEGTIRYLTTYLMHPDGAFYSAEDADSEGEEGKFYVWGRDELDEVLGPEDGAEAAHIFGATPHGNFEGSNILYRPTTDPWTDRIESIRRRLLEHRDRRVRPGLDDKVISSWNGLAVRALAEAGAALERSEYLQAAARTARFLLEEMSPDGELARSWRRGRSGVPGFLEDYAGTAVGLFSLYQATGNEAWYSEAARLCAEIPRRFADPEGGFFDTPDDGETLIKRPKSLADNPLPSGNGLAAEAMLTWHGYTGDGDALELALGAFRSAGVLIEQVPTMVAHHLAVLHSNQARRELAVVGPSWPELARAYWERYRPEVVLSASDDGNSRIPLLQDRAVTGKTLAYLCRQHVCDLPVSDVDALREQLG